MARMGSFNTNDLKKFQNELNKLQNPDIFVKACAKELAARMLTLVIDDTPVREYPSKSGRTGGTLRRGWVSKTYEEAENGRKDKPNLKEVNSFLNSLQIERNGDQYKIELINPVEYASYVEFGHRTANHKGWVPGQFMMSIAADEIQKAAPRILERKIEKYLKGCMK